jgi:hypothetical protein
MAKNRHSKSRSRRGGAPVFVGSPWAPAASNMHQDLTAPSAIGNYFKPSSYGVPGGGFQPPVPEINGPDRYQINELSPPVALHKGGHKRSNSKRSTYKRSGPKRSTYKRSGHKRSTYKRSTYKRSGPKRSTYKRSGPKRSTYKRGKRGGYSLGGFPQLASTAWDNAIVGIQNVANGINGTQQLPSASPGDQPELTKPPNIPLAKPIDIASLRTTAAQRAANA